MQKKTTSNPSIQGVKDKTGKHCHYLSSPSFSSNSFLAKSLVILFIDKLEFKM